MEARLIILVDWIAAPFGLIGKLFMDAMLFFFTRLDGLNIEETFWRKELPVLPWLVLAVRLPLLLVLLILLRADSAASGCLKPFKFLMEADAVLPILAILGGFALSCC